jgi:polyisoprenoid-binding protein YceI
VVRAGSEAMNRHAMQWTAAAMLFATTVAAAAPSWQTDGANSRLTFIGTQAGAEFTGRFETFAADIEFAPDELGSSRFDVRIDTGSVDTDDAERDSIIRGPDLFAVESHPQARYVASEFQVQDDGYLALGELTLRGETHRVPVRFTFERTGGGARLRGAASLERLEFGVGQGEWQDTEWVGNEVEIRFDLSLKPAP